MKLDEGIRVQPVTARSMASLDDDDLGVGVFDQAVDERDAHRARTHDEVVGLYPARLDHGVRLTPEIPSSRWHELRVGLIRRQDDVIFHPVLAIAVGEGVFG